MDDETKEKIKALAWARSQNVIDQETYMTLMKCVASSYMCKYLNPRLGRFRNKLESRINKLCSRLF